MGTFIKKINDFETFKKFRVKLYGINDQTDEQLYIDWKRYVITTVQDTNVWARLDTVLSGCFTKLHAIFMAKSNKAVERYFRRHYE